MELVIIENVGSIIFAFLSGVVFYTFSYVVYSPIGMP